LKISVFICTYNRGRLINLTLDALIFQQTRKPDEIIIVNGGGNNDCQPILEKWKNSFNNFKIINTDNINLAYSRNVGLPHCSGDLILQTDDDARPLPDWIQLIEEAHEKYPQAGVIGGDVIDADGRLFLSQIADAATFPHHNTVCEVRNVPGVNSSYKKEAIEQIGKYDTTLFRGEDVDYNWRAIKNGWKVIYLPDIKVLHVHRPTWRGLFFQHFMYGRANFLVRSKWPDMYSPYPLKLNSTYSILKWIASWIWFPWIDAYHKAKNMKNEINGFDCLVLGLVNIGNRIGIAIQRNII